MDQDVIANFKHFYRSGVIKRLVDVLDNDFEPLLIDMKGAIKRSVTAWNKVKPSTIKNCFVKAGHRLKHPIIEPLIDIEEPTIDQEIWRRVEPTDTISYLYYIQVDTELATSRTISERSIVNDILRVT
jgi:hypothetical protein